MQGYTKPIVMPSGLSEGVFASSGDGKVAGGIGCDSQYMQGVYRHPDYSDWAGKTRSYLEQFGCLGCPAYTDTECGLQSHYEDANKAESYNVDNGNRMPSWERKGYKPDAPVEDWAM